MTARVQWFAVDPDQDDMPTARIMADALARHDVSGVLATLAPFMLRQLPSDVDALNERQHKQSDARKPLHPQQRPGGKFLMSQRDRPA